MLVRVHTHTRTHIPHSLYLGVRKAGYLRARGKYSISCLIWDISLPVLLLTTRGLVLEGKLSREMARSRTLIDSPEREGLCEVERGLALLKGPHNLIGSLFPQIFVVQVPDEYSQ